MGKNHDMIIAMDICGKLRNLIIANPSPDAPTQKLDKKEDWVKRAMKIAETENEKVVLNMAMAHSLAAAVKAKVKVGAKTSSKSVEYIIKEGQEVIKTKFARCDQCAAAVLVHLLKEPDFDSYPIEMLGNKMHCWLLCARKDAGNTKSINKIEKWGSKAFQIDLWTGLQYKMIKHSVDANPMKNEYNKEWAKHNGGSIFVIQTFYKKKATKAKIAKS